MSEASFFGRFALAFRTFFRVLFDAQTAYELGRLGSSPSEPGTEDPGAEEEAPSALAAQPPRPSEGAALQLLGLLQREARFVDFVQQDITGFSDAQVGQAARLVHEGAAKVLSRYFSIGPVLAGEEGKPVTVEPGFDPDAVRLVGSVSGSAPYRGVLNHGGWRTESVTLPELVGDYDPAVLAPAEVEV